MREVNEKDLIAAVWGGAVLGGGGGGSPKAGYRLGKKGLEIGRVLLSDVDELDTDDTVVTAGLVGSPKKGGLGPTAESYVDAFSFFQYVTGTEISAVNSNECGGLATVNGWLQAAGLGVPVVDAPCNGRAHPTALMGAMGLHKDMSYVSRQVAVGEGSRMYVEGTLGDASSMVREFSKKSGLVAVARNPVSVGYVKRNAACGGISKCIELGYKMATHVERELGFDPLQPEYVGGSPDTWKDYPLAGYFASSMAAMVLGGVITIMGQIKTVNMVTKGGFDVGEVEISSFETNNGNGTTAHLTFMNEYLSYSLEGHVIFSFPDLIAVMDMHTGWPVSSAEIKQGMEVIVFGVPSDKLILGAGMYDKELYKPLEEATGLTFNLPVSKRRANI
ncbi:MAG: DUF917 family protein [Firmicutes bacterium]|jgi:hypothetical protein|nr:DUF917 family protein [Candidatus Fermentithermobacillaceae bacterium]